MKKFRQHSRGAKRRLRQRARRTFLDVESLEPRLLLHGGVDSPHGHAPEHGLDEHIHANLLIYVDGVKEEIPADLGVDNTGIISFIHTHDPDERLHLHPVDLDGDSAADNPADFLTVGDFFETWRTNAGTPGNRVDAFFDEDRIFDNVVDDTHVLRMYVNGVQVNSYEDYQIHDEDNIVIAYGSELVVAQHTNFVSLNTNYGSIVVEMLPGNAPGTVANFLNYVNDGDYVNSIVHRSDPGFVIQGGGYVTSNTTFTDISQFTDVPSDPPITNEPDLSNTIGTMAMARLGGQVNSATNQWFINLGNNNFLDGIDGGFTVFGNVLDMTPVDAIVAVPIQPQSSPFNELPVDTDGTLVVVQSVTGDGIVQGTVFDDIDGNGSQQGGEAGLAGFTVYADQDDDGQLDANEFHTVSASDGTYQLRLPNGSQTIRQELNAPFRQGIPVPPAGQVVTVEVGGTLGDVNFANTVVTSPGTPDLVAAFDTGLDDADNITSNNNSSASTLLQFTVGNVIDGALVRLLSGNVEIGQTVASGGQAVITTTGTVGLVDGVNSIKAIQVIGGGDSLPGGTLAVTVDTAVAAFSSTAPTTATIATPFSYDVANPEEGSTGFSYTLVDGLAGMSIDATSGVISWLPVASQKGNQQFSVLATDAAGNQGSHQVDLTVEGEVVVEFTVELTDDQGQPVTSVAAGDQFLVRVLVEDTRSQPQGVFSAYTDVLFDTSLATVSGFAIDLPANGAEQINDGETLTFNHPGPDGSSGNTDDLQLVLEFDKDSSVAASSVAIEIVDGDSASLVASKITSAINNDLSTTRLELELDATVRSGGELHVFTTSDTELEVSAGSQVTKGTPIIYGPIFPSGQTGVVGIGDGVIDEAGAFSGTSPNGAGQFFLFSVPVRADKGGELVFQADPADISFSETSVYGTDTEVDPARILYGSDSLTVTVNFTANNDFVQFDEDTSGNSISVMGNDVIPGGSSAKITAVGQTNNGGSVAIATDQLSLVYTPLADYFGLETFSYSIGDETGDSSAIVTVEVFPQNDNPTAVDDSFDVDEDSSSNLLDMLGNDSFLPDAGETLSITSTGTLSAGGSVTIASNGSHLLYTPLANFDGTETFSYTISDGNGGTDTAVVTVNLLGTGDNPVAQSDSLSVVEDSTDNSLDVLDNDTTPDANTELLITAVTLPSEGGTVTIANDQKSILYTPATDFFGQEIFNYTVTTGSSGSDQAVVIVTVADQADPPTANADVFQVVVDSPGENLDPLSNDTSAPDGVETLTITAVTATAQGGTVTIEQSGTLVQYIPPTSFLGQDSFSYTITDDDGLTDQAQVTVNVDNFQPGDISGTVFIDVDGDGIQDASEMVLKGITISLSGTDFESNAVQLTRTTDSSGGYLFDNLAPGNYVVTETQPETLLDGLEIVDSAAGTVTGENEITIQLVEGANLTSTNFAERGRTAETLSLADFSASRRIPSLLVCTGTGPGLGWVALDSTWSSFDSVDATLAAGNGGIDISVTDDGQSELVTVNMGSGGDPVSTLYTEQSHQLLAISGTPEVLGIQSGEGEAEGEPVPGEVIVDEAFRQWNVVKPSDPLPELEEISWQEDSQGEYQAAVDLLLENWRAG